MVTTMKKKINFFDRPPSVSSGNPLGKRVVVQHRCDILLEEQVDKVQDIQDCLQRELVALDLSRTLTEISQHQEKVEELKNQLDEMLLLLKVAGKMTAEMKHSRAQLRRHLKQGVDVTVLRKRVSWLERRIEKVLQTQAQQSCKLDNKTQIVTSSPDDTAADKIEDVRPGDTEELPGTTEQPTTPQLTTEQHIVPVATDQTAEEHGTTEQVTEVQDRIMAKTSTEILMSPTRQKPVFKPEPGEEKYDGHTEVGLTQCRSDTPYHAPYPQVNSAESSFTAEKASRRLPSGDRTTLSDSSSSSSSTSSSDEEDEEEESEEEEEEDLDEEEEDQEEEEEEVETEVKLVSVLRKDTPLQSSGRQSRVTIQTGEGELEEPAPSPVLADEYWASEHHRFKFSDSIDALLQNDPLSYHSMGMAVPGTFIEEPESTGVELPWRQRRKGSDIVDVHKIALDKLSVRVHQMYRKVKEAALLSVEKTKDDYLGRLVLGGTVSRVEMSERDFPSPSLAQPTLARFGVTRASSRETVVFPPLDKERLGSSMSGRLIYYPKPLPYPDKCQHRTIVTKEELPALASHFRPGECTEPPQRIVNQHNLYNETKFTSSLYKPKLGLSGEERKLLQMKEEEERKKRERLRKRRRREEEKKPAPTLKTTFALAAAVVKITAADDRWNEMKPKSGALEHSGLKWERVKNIIHNSLVSPNVEERVNAARQLGALKCCDTMVLFALRERVKSDECDRVRYEAAKSLITLGLWEEEVLEQVLEHLINGSRETKADLLEHIIDGKNVQFVNKKAEVFPELVKVLSLLCKNSDSTDVVSFRAAVCLGKLCVQDKNAQEKLSQVLEQTDDTHIRAEALKMLIKQMCYHEQDVVVAALVQLQRSPAWRLRKEAANLLIHLGKKYVCADHQTDFVYELLEKRLWDDPNKEVRNEVAMVLAALQLYPRACETIEKKLEAPREDVRAQAVISLGTLRMKNDRVIKQLLEMLDLDSSEYVRLMILRTLATLRSTERKVIRSLREREKGDGSLANEAKKTLEILGLPLNPTSTK